jgi:hypothetical protein
MLQDLQTENAKLRKQVKLLIDNQHGLLEAMAEL